MGNCLSPTINASVLQHTEEVSCTTAALETKRLEGGELASKLCKACRTKDYDKVVSLLQSFDCDLSATVYGRTALHYAAAAGSTSIMKLLLSHGANLDRRSERFGPFIDFRKTPLHSAAEATKNAGEVIRFLYALGATPFVYGSIGDTPLYHANGAEAAAALVEYSYWQARQGVTFFDTTAVLELLDCRDDSGKTALEFLRSRLPCRKKHPESWQKTLETVEYLESWTMARICLPACYDDEVSTNSSLELSVMKNPALSELQTVIADGLQRTIEQSAIAEVTYVVMGYLCPADLLNRWDMWL